MADKKTKQPRERLDYDIIADKRLTDDDSIVSVQASYTGPDTLLTITRITWTSTVAKIWLEAGTDGCTYKVTAVLTTANGREIESEFMLQVRDL